MVEPSSTTQKATIMEYVTTMKARGATDTQEINDAVPKIRNSRQEQETGSMASCKDADTAIPSENVLSCHAEQCNQRCLTEVTGQGTLLLEGNMAHEKDVPGLQRPVTHSQCPTKIEPEPIQSIYSTEAIMELFGFIQEAQTSSIEIHQLGAIADADAIEDRDITKVQHDDVDTSQRNSVSSSEDSLQMSNPEPTPNQNQAGHTKLGWTQVVVGRRKLSKRAPNPLLVSSGLPRVVIRQIVKCDRQVKQMKIETLIIDIEAR